MSQQGGLRQAMAGVHTWGGLVAGWLLFAIFLTGTLAVFASPITRWMKPELQASRQSELPRTDIQRTELLHKGLKYLERTASNSTLWSISLPDAADPAIQLAHRNENGRPQRQWLDAVTGQSLPKRVEVGRATEGGHHFVLMHYAFQAGSAGVWLVGFVTMTMLVAMVSGIIIHKRIFKDFFTFRLGKGQRSWLDAHNALSVLTLPFQLMIAYTGLVIYYAVYMPAGIVAHFGEPQDFRQELRARESEPEKTGIAAPMVALDGLLQQAEETLGRPAGAVRIANPGDSSASVSIIGRFDQKESDGRLLGRYNTGQARFDGVTGQLLAVEMPGTFKGGGAYATERTMTALHFADFGGTSIRWLYFLLGTAGAAMMATGCVLFLVKRRQKSLNEFGVHTARVYRVIEVFNVASIAGVAVACIGFLWLNRLIPVELEDRASWEVRGFFAIWGLTLAHAAVLPARRVWVEQLALCGTLCLALPLLNWMTTDDQVFAYWLGADWERFGVELTAIVFGILSLYGAVRVRSAAISGTV